MIQFDFQDYPKFYDCFRSEMNANKFSTALISIEEIKRLLDRKFGLTVEIYKGSTLWTAYMDEEQFTLFLLKWS